MTWTVTNCRFTIASIYGHHSLPCPVYIVITVYHGSYISSPQFTMASIYGHYSLPWPVYMVTTVYHGQYIWSLQFNMPVYMVTTV